MSGWFTNDENGRRVEIVVCEDMVARRFAERHADRLRFCHDAGAWFSWDGAIWRRDRTGATLGLVREMAQQMAQEYDGPLRTAGGTRFVGGVENFARIEPALAATDADWDKDTMRLGTPGGSVDLATGALLPADPQDGITRATSVSPAETADCPVWRGFLDQATGDDSQLIRFLQQFLGYVLTGETREHTLLFGHGDGGNGKTVFLNTIAGIMGDYATVAAPDLLTSGAQAPAGDLARLAGARLVTASESEAGQAWAEARLKLLTGGDPVTTRLPRREAFTFKPRFKLIIVGNHLPVLRGIDAAMRRRFRLVPFERTPREPDRTLEAKLKTEWPQILRWMIEGCLDWQANGLVLSNSVRAASSFYLGSQDFVGQFLEETCDRADPMQRETAAALYAAWCKYAKAAGEVPGSQRVFAAALARRGMIRDRTRMARIYRGIRLRTAEERARA